MAEGMVAVAEIKRDIAVLSVFDTDDVVFRTFQELHQNILNYQMSPEIEQFLNEGNGWNGKEDLHNYVLGIYGNVSSLVNSYIFTGTVNKGLLSSTAKMLLGIRKSLESVNSAQLFLQTMSDIVCKLSLLGDPNSISISPSIFRLFATRYPDKCEPAILSNLFSLTNFTSSAEKVHTIMEMPFHLQPSLLPLLSPSEQRLYFNILPDDLREHYKRFRGPYTAYWWFALLANVLTVIDAVALLAMITSICLAIAAKHNIFLRNLGFGLFVSLNALMNFIPFLVTYINKYRNTLPYFSKSRLAKAASIDDSFKTPERFDFRTYMTMAADLRYQRFSKNLDEDFLKGHGVLVEQPAAAATAEEGAETPLINPAARAAGQPRYTIEMKTLCSVMQIANRENRLTIFNTLTTALRTFQCDDTIIQQLAFVYDQYLFEDQRRLVENADGELVKAVRHRECHEAFYIEMNIARIGSKTMFVLRIGAFGALVGFAVIKNLTVVGCMPALIAFIFGALAEKDTLKEFWASTTGLFGDAHYRFDGLFGALSSLSPDLPEGEKSRYQLVRGDDDDESVSDSDGNPVA